MQSHHCCTNPTKHNSFQFPLCLALLAVGLCVSACHHEPADTKAADPAGTYMLTTIDGNKLPCRPAHEGGAPEVKSGSITLNADGTFTSSMTYGSPDAKTGSRDFSGTYTREHNRFTLHWKGAGITTADLEGSTLTMNNEGMLFAYRK